MTPDHDTDPLEHRLRHSLSTRADDAPDAHALTERLLAAGGQRRVRRWTTFGTPLLAAACVAAIVAIVLAIVQPGHSDHGPDSSDSLPVPVSSVVTPAPSPRNSSSPASPTSSATRSTPALRNVRIVDLTFTSANSGWALASADCLTGSGRCTALLRSTDGTTWAGRADTPFDVSGVSAGCPARLCVSGIRFANDSVGYAYGPDALFMTRDGAAHWTQLSGGADALETLDGNVIRVVDDHGGCPGPCNVGVETAAIGSDRWTSVGLPGGTVDAGTLALARTGSDAFLTTSQGPAASLYYVVLFTSHDDGAHWIRSADPCRTHVATSVVTQDLTVASDGSVSVHCAGASGANAAIIASTDGGVSFAAPQTVTGVGVVPSAAHGSGLGPIGAASARVLIGYGAGGLYRSADGGHTWRRVVADTSNGTVRAPGFQTSTVGRWVSPDTRTIWTTRDAGATWTRADP